MDSNDKTKKFYFIPKMLSHTLHASGSAVAVSGKLSLSNIRLCTYCRCDLYTSSQSACTYWIDVDSAGVAPPFLLAFLSNFVGGGTFSNFPALVSAIGPVDRFGGGRQLMVHSISFK